MSKSETKIVYLSIFEKRHHKKEPSKKFIKKWFRRGEPWGNRIA